MSRAFQPFRPIWACFLPSILYQRLIGRTIPLSIAYDMVTTARRKGGGALWTNWVSIHQSFGLPRVAQDCRAYLEHNGIRVRFQMNRKQTITSYYLLVPKAQEQDARELLTHFRRNL
jgi:hypothetical protein